jgi:membrane-bound lytic murein transglycosylase B
LAEVRKALVILMLALSLAPAARAQTADNDFASWLRGMEQDAVAEGISPDTAHTVLENAILDDHVIELDQKQPEKTVTFEDYARRIVSSERVAAGQEKMRDYVPLLAELTARYGVPPEIIVALWGIESSYGANSGDYNIVNSLASLAYEGRRAGFFRGELIAALRIVDAQHISPDRLRGSWAGAMGECQFMPSTYLNYAASYSGGTPDIWDNTADVLASIANYALADGWDAGIPGWGREVTLAAPIDDDEVGLPHKHWLSEWAQMGVREADGAPLEGMNLEASLIAPDGADGRHFLVYDNYRALMKWNRSTYFATSVGLLADRIK